jgi:hypothetical protein
MRKSIAINVQVIFSQRFNCKSINNHLVDLGQRQRDQLSGIAPSARVSAYRREGRFDGNQMGFKAADLAIGIQHLAFSQIGHTKLSALAARSRRKYD